jgi:hypothetical protein
MRSKLGLVIFNRQREKVFYFGKFPLVIGEFAEPHNTVMIAFRPKVLPLGLGHTPSSPRSWKPEVYTLFTAGVDAGYEGLQHPRK